MLHSKKVIYEKLKETVYEGKEDNDNEKYEFLHVFLASALLYPIYFKFENIFATLKFFD